MIKCMPYFTRTYKFKDSDDDNPFIKMLKCRFDQLYNHPNHQLKLFQKIKFNKQYLVRLFYFFFKDADGYCFNQAK